MVIIGIGNMNMVIIVIGNVNMVIIGKNITYDTSDAPQVLRSSPELQTLLILPEQLPGSMLP